MIKLGKAVRLHGIRGAIKISTKFDKDFDLNKIKQVFDKNGNGFAVNRIFPTADGVIVELDGVDLAAARGYIGSDFYISREVVGDRILYEDLKGSVAIVAGKQIGKIVDVQDFGTAEVITVLRGDGSELLFPGVSGVIENFDLSSRQVTLSEKILKEVSDYED